MATMDLEYDENRGTNPPGALAGTRLLWTRARTCSIASAASRRRRRRPRRLRPRGRGRRRAADERASGFERFTAGSDQIVVRLCNGRCSIARIEDLRKIHGKIYTRRPNWRGPMERPSGSHALPSAAREVATGRPPPPRTAAQASPPPPRR